MGKQASKATSAAEVADIMKNTRYTKEEIEQWSKVFKKEFPKGKMTKKEAKRVIAKEFPNFNSEAVSDYLFKALDLDGDGLVDFREFLISQSILNDGRPSEKLRFIFKMYDIDGNNYIEQSELETIFKAIYKGAQVPNAHQKAAEEAREFIRQSDLDGDGHLSEYEFVRFMLPKVTEVLDKGGESTNL